jgi:hypothetical protein
MLWHGRHLLVSTLRTVRWEADQADEVLGIAAVQVAAVVAVHGSSVPWGQVDTDGVTVIPARRVSDLLAALPPVLGPERVAGLADRARLRFRPAAQHGRRDRQSGLVALVCLPSLNGGPSQPRQARPVRRGHSQALLRMAESRGDTYDERY